MNFNNKIVYQIYPKSFYDTNGDGIGDIPGIIEKLDYIAKLGVDYIWLSPVNCSLQRDNGYDISDYYDIDPMYGTIEDYKNLIVEAKKFNISIMMDLVLNHVSDESRWFKDAKDMNSKYHDYFIWRDEPNKLSSHFDLTPKSAWTFCPEVGKYYLHLFDKHQPDLNWDNEVVRCEIKKVINFWHELGINAFRLDAIDMIGKKPDELIKNGGPMLHTYLQEILSDCNCEDMLIVGECCISSVEEAKRLCESGITQVFHFENVNYTEGKTKWEQSRTDNKQLAAIIEKWSKSGLDSQTWVMNNHDLPRLISKWGNDKELRYECATCYATLFSLLDGTQYIYQGEEIGMTNPYFESMDKYRDVESLNMCRYFEDAGYSDVEILQKLQMLSRDNSRVPMQWDDAKNRGFTDGKPWIDFNDYNHANVQSDLQCEKSVYKYYQQLIEFKKTKYKQYIVGGIDKSYSDRNTIVLRKNKMWIICNMTGEERKFELPTGEIKLNNYMKLGDVLNPYQAIVIIEEDN